MWQIIAVIIIGIAAVAYTGYKIRRILTASRKDDPCAHCGGCPLNNKGNCGGD